MADGPRILLIDIETAPIDALVWQKSLYNTNVRVEQVEEDTHLFSYAAKWLGEKQMIYSDQSRRRDIRNDRPLLVELQLLLDEADIVVAHNGRAFDLPFVMTRMAGADIPPPSPFRQVDTYRIAKSQFGFTFNSLEFLGRALGCRIRKSQHKKFPGIQLWRECKAGNQDAWAEMKLYNIDDVLLLEQVYLKLRPWFVGHPNVGMYVDSKEPVCPKCGGRVQKRGVTRTNTGTYQRYHCQNEKCGGYSRGRQLMDTTSFRRRQLSN